MTAHRKRFVLSLLAIVSAGPAFAHAAEQGFVLLLPTTAYITGGTIAVAATIVLISVLRPGQLARAFAPVDTGIPCQAATAAQTMQILSSFALAVLVGIGTAGPSDPQANLLPLVTWTILWMAVFVIQGLVFDIWKWLNPWPGLHRLVFPNHRAWLDLPRSVAIWPATAIFLAFQGFVLADPAPNDPGRLALFVLGYWVFTFAGMTLFGRGPWLRHVEVFTVLMTLVGTMRAAACAGTLRLGLPGWQVAGGPRPGLSHAIFALILLGAGSFDGLHETFWWLAQMGVNPLEFPGRSAMIQQTTLGLLAAIALLIALYGLAVWLGVAWARRHPIDGRIRASEAFLRLSVALLPIAIGYHLAHYLVTFLVQGQVVLATLADPLARGWNLFGLGDLQVKVGFLAVPGTVRLIWVIQAAAVVMSHILAVLISHRIAETLSGSRAGAARLQAGLSILMVAYTIFGLWLLASPRGA